MRASPAGVMFWLSAASCVVAEVAIVRATLRVSGTSATQASVALPHPRRWLEIVWVALPAIALAAILVGTGRAILLPHADPHVSPPVAGALPSPR